VAPQISLLDADAELLAELLAVAQQQARKLQEQTGSVRLHLDLLVSEPGLLRLELTPLR